MDISEFQFDLKSPIKVPVGGQQVDCSLLILKAPSNKQRAHALLLDEMFSKVKSESESKSKPKDESVKEDKEPVTNELLAEWILDIFKSSLNVSYVLALDEFRKLILMDDICKVEGEYKLTQNMFDQISIADSTKLFGAYMVNFIISSAFRDLVTG